MNENTDQGLRQDILNALETLFPSGNTKYKHRGENADAHIKNALVGTSVTLLIEDRALKLGRWQSLYLCEFDGPRERELWVKILAG
jgi:secondary thiamine-phosphate synthase enzyme